MCFVVLSSIAGLHTCWILGSFWPATSDLELIPIVSGDPNTVSIQNSTILPYITAVIYLGAIFSLLRGAFDWRSIPFIRLPLVIIGSLFIFRGLATYTDLADKYTIEPFVSLNAYLYSPVIAMLGIGMFFLAVTNAKPELILSSSHNSHT